MYYFNHIKNKLLIFCHYSLHTWQLYVTPRRHSRRIPRNQEGHFGNFTLQRDPIVKEEGLDGGVALLKGPAPLHVRISGLGSVSHSGTDGLA